MNNNTKQLCQDHQNTRSPKHHHFPRHKATKTHHPHHPHSRKLVLWLRIKGCLFVFNVDCNISNLLFSFFAAIVHRTSHTHKVHTKYTQGTHKVHTRYTHKVHTQGTHTRYTHTRVHTRVHARYTHTQVTQHTHTHTRERDTDFGCKCSREYTHTEHTLL